MSYKQSEFTNLYCMKISSLSRLADVSNKKKVKLKPKFHGNPKIDNVF